MIITSFRIIKLKHAADALSGSGASMFGGRWNSIGTPLIYTAESRALAALEMLAHLQNEELRQRYLIYELAFDDAVVEQLDDDRLPEIWRTPQTARSLQRMGDAWVASRRSPVLRVPSVLVPAEHNYLINPDHSDFGKISMTLPQPFRFDRRLKSSK